MDGWGGVLAADDKALFDDIHDALIASGIDASALRVEVDGDHVVVRGQVRDRACADRIAGVIEQVPGVRTLVDQLTW
jgi:osmotically-inducible protein OsmY